MEPNKKMNKKFFLTCFVLIFLGATGLLSAYFMVSGKNGYELEEYEYTLDTGLTFTAVRVTGMKDKALQEKINDSLCSYFFIMEDPMWFAEEYAAAMPYVIHCRTERYLSVEYRFDNLRSDLAKHGMYHYCVTVDMKTGELVCLDDLVRVDESFAEFVKHGNVLHRGESKFMDWTAEEASQELNHVFEGYETDYILIFFRNYTSEYLYGDYYRDMWRDEWPDMPPAYGSTGLYTHGYFYIEDGYIYMQYGEPNYNTIWIAAEDIEDYLMVPVW